MMYYNCQHCNKPIKKPYPSKKYCSVGCRDNNRRERVEEQERSFWNSIPPLAISPDVSQELSQLPEPTRAGVLIRGAAPAGAVGYRVGCRRVGAETYTVHWFPTERQRRTRLFKLEPIEPPFEIPCPAEYIVVYFDASGNPLDVPRFKLTLRARLIGILWSEGDRSLRLDRMHR
jgi:hypothetical protein